METVIIDDEHKRDNDRLKFSIYLSFLITVLLAF